MSHNKQILRSTYVYESTWTKLCNATDKALEEAAAVLEIFNDLEFIEPALNDFVKELVPYLENLQEELYECVEENDDDNEAEQLKAELVEQLMDESDVADGTFSCIDDIPDSVLDLLGHDIDDDVSSSIYDFIEKRLKPVRKAVWHLYDVMIKAD